MIWLWVWTVSSCFGGDIAAIVTFALEHRVGLIVKTHDGATSAPNGYLGFRLIEECQKAGVPVRSWGYCYPNISAELQADFAAQAGVDYIADVEVEYDGQTAAAAALVDALRSKLPGKKLGYAPLPIVSYHDQGATYEQFNRLDVCCPQAYAGTGDRPAASVLDWTEAEFARMQPINLEPAVYAADQPASELRVAIAAVRAKVQAFGADGDLSIWSLQHLTPEHVAVIDEFTQGDDMNGDTVKNLIREMLESDEGAVLVKAAVLHPGGYGQALEVELEALRKQAAAAGTPVDEAKILRDATANIIAKLSA
jgi:hypothetical protein